MKSALPRARRAPAPLDAAALDQLALRYVERFATTRVRLAAYLGRKIRERGWEGEAVDPMAIAERLAALGYIDDRRFGEARAAAMARRGLGGARVMGALRAAGIDGEDREALARAVDAREEAAALRFARRRRIGPFAPEPPDGAARARQLAAMMRAGHSLEMARRALGMALNDAVETIENHEFDGSFDAN